MASNIAGMLFVPYYNHLMEILNTDPNLRRTAKGRVTVFLTISAADPGFPRGGGGGQHTILPNFPENCMKSKEFGPLAP